MRDKIIVDKSLIPYGFDILLGAEWYTLDFNYNSSQCLFTVTLTKDDVVLVYDEPIMYGVALFTDLYQSGIFPMLDIVPYDESEQESSVTWDNFGETVFLCVF